MLAKQGGDQLGRFFGREELLDRSIMNPANLHFQCWLALDVAIPIRFAFPPGHHEHLTGPGVVVQDFQNCPTDLPTLAATVSNLHDTVTENPPKTKPVEPPGSIGQPP